MKIRGPYKKYMENGIPKSTYFSRLKKGRQLLVDEVQNADVSIKSHFHYFYHVSSVINIYLLSKN